MKMAHQSRIPLNLQIWLFLCNGKGWERAGFDLYSLLSPSVWLCQGNRLYMYHYFFFIPYSNSKSSLVTQWVKDPWLLLLCHGFNSWPGNFHMPTVCQKKKKKFLITTLYYCFVIPILMDQGTWAWKNEWLFKHLPTRKSVREQGLSQRSIKLPTFTP